MQFELTIFLLLLLILFFLIFLYFNIKKHSNTEGTFEIKKINENLDNLLNKTLQQQGAVNSKINEIGDLTKKMTSAMTSNISDMGSMGEAILENILEDCGMTKERDYKIQVTAKDDSGNSYRPDVVIFLPDNRNIIIDSKVSMKDWYEFQNSNIEEDRKSSISKFILALKNHIKNIDKKNYTSLLGINSPDYIFIFMPHEYAYITAQKYDPSIATLAQERKIIVVGPSTLIMCMKLVESIWKTEKQNKNSAEIAKIAGQMYDQIISSIKAIEESEKVILKAFDSLKSAKNSIKDGKGSLFEKAETMRRLGADNKKKLD